MREKQIVQRIGIFDSGAGGLTVLKTLRDGFPGVHFFYLGDTARLPYGTKSAETIIRYTHQNVAFLLSKKIDLLIVACNTASAHAMSELRKTLALPVLGVIEPGARRAAAVSATGRIGVIGTRGTILSCMYQKFILSHRPDAVVHVSPAPILVPLVEEGLTTGPITEAAIRLYVDPMMEKNVDTLVLGCTHYPLLQETIAGLYPGLTLVNSATPIREALSTDYRIEQKTGRTEIYVTDYPETFTPLSEQFLGASVDKIEHIDLQKLWRKRK